MRVKKQRRAQKKRQAKAEAKLLDHAAQRHSEMLNPCMLSVLLYCTIFFSLVPCFTIFPACVINVTLCVCRACVYLSEIHCVWNSFVFSCRTSHSEWSLRLELFRLFLSNAFGTLSSFLVELRVWNSFVFSCRTSHSEWSFLRCLSFCR